MNSKLIPLCCAALAVLVARQSLAQTLDEGPADGSFDVQGSASSYSQLGPTDADYASGFRQRTELLANAKTWNYANCNWGDADAGKRAWPQLLAEMYKVKDNASELQRWIDEDGNEVLTNRYNNTSTFNKPFSCPGYTMYYFTFKDKLPSSQITAAKNMVNSEGFSQMMREDGKMDPIYDNTEKNSENFNWMARLSGYLWAEELGKNESYFDSYVKNWTRALFNTGRVEWNSSIYWGYCWNPCMVLYEFAQNSEMKTRAKASMDWQLLNLALHYIDGATTGADVRAKTGSYKPFHGTAWLYGYLYFADNNHHPSYAQSDAQEAMKWQMQMSGFPCWSSYQPPQVILDIARRKYATPVEIHSAKPFYQSDYDNYAHWKGDHELSRRFDFETIYLEKNYTLSSVATNVPEGVDCFWEQSVWKMAVKGSGNGAVQIFGNAGGFENSNLSCGRSPYEEIGQYRNCMMRLIKGADHMWVAFPKSISVETKDKIAFANMGSDVYVAFVPHRATSTSKGSWSQNDGYNKYTWNYSKSSVGVLVLEVGTKEEHGSYDAFKSAITANTSFSTPENDIVEYTATSGRKIKMQYMPPKSSYTYWHGVPGQGTTKKTASPAGVTPKVWVDGQYLDFSTWQSLHVTHGEKIVEQNWGSGALTAMVGGKGMQIVVDPSTAKVQYREVDGPTEIRTMPGSRQHSRQFVVRGTSLHLARPLRNKDKLAFFDARGRCLQRIRPSAEMRQISFPDVGRGVLFMLLNRTGEAPVVRHIVGEP